MTSTARAAVHKSFCRACINSCPTLVEVADDRLIKVSGNPDNPIFQGYTCTKGRAQPALHHHPDRLLHSLKRQPDGSYVEIPTETAISEVAARLAAIIDRHGPRAVATYRGNGLISDSGAGASLEAAFMDAIGSPMRFDAGTIDKPGKQVAKAFHGAWQAPAQGYDRPEVALVLGANSFRSYYGTPCGSPTVWLREHLGAGRKLIVVDPRETELAKRATLHLKIRPGTDAQVLAALLHVILAEKLTDEGFVADNVDGLARLTRVVDRFSPEEVARRADVPAEDLVAAARMYATAGRGYAAAGVGPGFSASSTLVEYLILCLETICGRWLRAGETVRRAPSTLKPPAYRAQATPPFPVDGGVPMRVHGLSQSPAGMPTGALPDEITVEGEGRVRALLSLGGNPATAWPDQGSVVDALEHLDLLVQVDPWMSTTASLADYVIAPTMIYEKPGNTNIIDRMITAPSFYGPAESYLHHTPAVIPPPPGADVIPEWMLLYRLGQRLGLTLAIPELVAQGSAHPALDMAEPPSSEDLLELLAQDARVPYDEIRQHPDGASFPDPAPVVLEKQPGWAGRLDVGSSAMLTMLTDQLHAPEAGGAPFRLIAQRLQDKYNSFPDIPAPARHRPSDPAALHPDDLAELGLTEGDRIRITSRRASIVATAHADATLRRGLVAMAYGFDQSPDGPGEVRSSGSPTGRLLDRTDIADPLVWMPRMSNIPVSVSRLDESVDRQIGD